MGTTSESWTAGPSYAASIVITVRRPSRTSTTAEAGL
jgi:hypothetical protein